MWRLHHVVVLLSVVCLCVVSRPTLSAPPAKKGTAKQGAAKQGGELAGIMFDHDRQNHWMTVKGDGDDAPVKYRIDPSDPVLAEDLKTVFNASRVHLLYKTDEDGSRRLLRVERQILEESGTVTGIVVNVHNNFWIELKPRRGVANAFAPGANYNDKAFMEKLKALKPGDSVTIDFTTDFERHRIVRLRKNAPTRQPKSKTEKSGASSSEKK